MTATIITLHNPFDPFKNRDIVILQETLTIAEWIQRNGPDPAYIPLLCFYQGSPLLRVRWNTTVIRSGDIVVFMRLPQGGGGGGGKNPLRAVLSIAAMVVAAPLSGMISGSLGITSTIGTSLITAGLAIGGAALVNVLVPPPKPHLLGGGYGSFGARTMSPTYSLQAQGNQARLDSPIPVIYGRHKVFPDFASLPYVEYRDNHQYLYQLHCIGQGHYEIEQLRLGESPLSSFEDVEHEILPPDTQPTLFDTGVMTCMEVSGQELPAPNENVAKKIIGPFVANPPQTQANAIGIDIILPRGLYYANNSGGLDAKSVTFEIQARAIGDKNEPIGDWITLGRETITAATVTPQRKSYRYSVNPGRYEVQLIRIDTKDTSARAGMKFGGLD